MSSVTYSGHREVVAGILRAFLETQRRASYDLAHASVRETVHATSALLGGHVRRSLAHAKCAASNYRNLVRSTYAERRILRQLEALQ